MLLDDSGVPKLVGIAKLAASSEVLEAKRRVEYLELETRRFIGRCSGNQKYFVWTVNPYRGCEFGCKYCYARYAHEFMELRDPELFENKIFVKRFVREAFRAELRRVKRGESVWIGTATDPYQPAERRFRITRQILEVIAGERGMEFGITTKSDLVQRDAELLGTIAKRNKIRVHMSVTTLDEKLVRLIEPRAPRPSLRMAAVRKLTSNGVAVSVLAHPIMPLINDSVASLELVCKAAAESGASGFSAATLFLKPCSRQVFLPFLDQHFPHLVRKYRERYEKQAYLHGAYPEMLHERVQKLKARYQFAAVEEREWPVDEQLALFSASPDLPLYNVK